MNRNTWIVGAVVLSVALVGSGYWLSHHSDPAATLPSLTLPDTVQGQPGAWVVVVPQAKTGGEVKWRVGPGLTLVDVGTLFPGTKPAGAVVQGPEGQYEVWGHCALGSVATDSQLTKVVIGKPVPPVPPGPVPPGPTPPVPPVPPVPPAPIPADGLHVLIVYDAKTLASLPKDQQLIFYAQSLRQYLDGKCPAGPDGKTKEYRIWPVGADVSQESTLWQDAYNRSRQSTPWIVISNGTKGGFEGPLPANTDATLELIKKYAEPAKVSILQFPRRRAA